MNGFRFKPNPNFAKQFALTPACRAMVNRAADAVEANAKQEVNDDTGHYGRSFERKQTPEGVVLGNKDFAAHIIEWGSVDNAPQAPLRNGSRAAGLRLDEKSK